MIGSVSFTIDRRSVAAYVNETVSFIGARCHCLIPFTVPSQLALAIADNEKIAGRTTHDSAVWRFMPPRGSPSLALA
jgi:hypothetical protein